MMLFLCNLQFVILIIEYIKPSFGQFCYDRKADGSTVRYCCANSEFRNEQCVECNLGFYTEAGGRCKPCKANHYGYKCIEYCNCRENQICDNVKGCLDVTVSTSTEYITTDFITFSTEATLTEETVLTTAFVTVYETGNNFILTDETNIQQKQKNESHYTTARFIAITKQQLIVFSLSAACFFLLLGLLFVCWKYKKKTKSRRITNLSLKDPGELVKKDKDKTADFNQDIKTNNSCSFESLYDEIDESSNHSSLNGEEDDYLHPYTSVPSTQIDLLKENTITSKNHHVQEDNSYSDDEVNEHKYSHLYQQLNEGWETRTPTYMTTVSSSKQNSTGTDASTPSYISPSPFPKEGVTVTDRSAPSYNIPPLSPNEDVKVKEDSAPSCIIQCISPNKDVTVKEDNAPSSIIVCPSLKEGVTITGDSTTSCITSCPSSKEGITMTDNIHIDNLDPLLDISHRNENKHATCSIKCDIKEHSLNCIDKVSLEAQEMNNCTEEVEIIQLKNDLANNQKSDLNKDREITILKELVSKLSSQCTRRNIGTDNFAENNITETKKYKRLLVGSIVPTVVPLPRTTAFYAYMSHNDASPGKGHTLKFDVIKTNINGGYHPFSGIFTVPADGVCVLRSA
ncbi:unnamed protein product [Mytilus coruscus]|uniref:C1q domain-containing protein n=1 Tax=Mytilus coruscus TaxID=42192 RepID=A0A6J8AKV5_MYTCO|nr:unnamed protein product [Mytilus coruscus]